MAIEQSDVEQVFTGLMNEGLTAPDRERIRKILETGEKEPEGTHLRTRYLEFSKAAEKYLQPRPELKERDPDLRTEFAVAWDRLENEVKIRESIEVERLREKIESERAERARAEEVERVKRAAEAERAEAVRMERERVAEEAPRAEREPRPAPTPPPPPATGPLPTIPRRTRPPQPPRTPIQELQRKNKALTIGGIIAIILLIGVAIYAFWLKSRNNDLADQNLALLRDNTKNTDTIADLQSKLSAAESRASAAVAEQDRIEASCFNAEDVNRVEQEHAKTVEQMLFSADRDCREGKERTAELTARETAKLVVGLCNELRYTRPRRGVQPGT